MDYTVIQEFAGKIVEIFTAKNSFSGRLTYNVPKAIAVVDPVSDYTQRRFGPVTIDHDAIIAIREIKPRVDDDNADENEREDHAL